MQCEKWLGTSGEPLDYFAPITITFIKRPTNLEEELLLEDSTINTYVGFLDYLHTKNITDLKEDVGHTFANLAAFALGAGELALAVETGNIFRGILATAEVLSTLADQSFNSYYLEQYLIEQHGEDKAKPMIAKLNLYNLVFQVPYIAGSAYNLWRIRKGMPSNGHYIARLDGASNTFVGESLTVLAKNDDRFINVVIHGEGSNFVMQIDGTTKTVGAEELAILIHREFSEGVNKTKEIRLLSCSNLAAAEQLSYATGRTVVATDASIHVYEGGKIGTDGSTWYRMSTAYEADGQLIVGSNGKPVINRTKIDATWDSGPPNGREHIRLHGRRFIDGFEGFIDDFEESVQIELRKLSFESEQRQFMDDFGGVEGRASTDILMAFDGKPTMVDAWNDLSDFPNLRVNPIHLEAYDVFIATNNLTPKVTKDEVVDALNDFGNEIDQVFYLNHLDQFNKENRIWRHVDYDAGYFSGHSNADFFNVRVANQAPREQVGVAFMGDDILEFHLFIPSNLQMQKLGTTIFKRSISEFSPSKVKGNWKTSNVYDGGESINLTIFKQKLADNYTLHQAAFATPTGKILQRNGFGGTPTIIKNTADEVVIHFNPG